MMWIKRIALSAAIGLLALSPLRAGSITADYGALGGTNFEQVSFVYNNNPYTFNTAQDQGTRTDDMPAGPGVDTLVPHAFIAYCVETDQNLYIGASNFHATVEPLLGSSTQLGGAPSSGPVFFDATRTLMMERLWGGFASQAVDQNTAAAFQLAVWEVAFDNDETLVGSGSLLHAQPADLANPNSPASIAEGWLAQVRDPGVVLPVQPLLLLTDPSTQDLITPFISGVPNTPEPASIALLAMGSLGLAIFARRKR